MCFILQLKSLTNRDTSAFPKLDILHVACATLLAPEVFVNLLDNGGNQLTINGTGNTVFGVINNDASSITG